MEVFKTKNEIKNTIKGKEKIAFVPTMGALHDGHFALISEAKKYADFVIVSIFVNKAQFNDLSDYEKYPRTLEVDLKKLEGKGIDAVFAPNHQEIFPDDENEFQIKSKNLANVLCGASRAGHFDGVCLIIAKLFNIIKPNFAIFGKKDFQQYLIIKKFVEDFNFDVEIIGIETIRENSGLAMSSRNKRLDENEQKIATNLSRILVEIKNEVKKAGIIKNILQNKKEELINIGFKNVDYLEIRGEKNLELITDFNNEKPCRVFVAGFVGQVRLIDNLKI